MPQIQEFNYYSHILGRDIPVEKTGHWGYPILMFPTTQGSYLQNRDFGLNASIYHLVDQGKVKLYNVQTLDAETLYGKHLPTDIKIHNYELYVQFLIKEFIPYLQNENNCHRIATAGCSFGGFHAANVSFRAPDMVSHIFALSAAFSIRSFAPGSEDDRIYFNSPNEYLRNADGWKFHHQHVVLGTSDWDICKPQNQEIAGILSNKNIPHWYDEKKWAKHDWPLWCMAFPEYVGTYFG